MLYAKVTNPSAGFDRDNEAVKTLSSTEIYIVDHISMGQSSSSVWLRMGDGVSRNPTAFNTVNFTFYKFGFDRYFVHNIFSDPYYNPYL